ncbi:MAG: hypothetical protein LBF16_08200 [Pseudomonadales bacterium]|nr:hypothetical protein [Pseudomonadales bacterium]
METPEYGRLAKSREVQLKQVRAIGRDGDLATIVTSERFLIQNELDRYANSTSMKSSLNEALKDFNRIEKHLNFVADPTQYRIVDEAHNKPKHRINGVPRDEARQAFHSQHTRLTNLDKSRLSAAEKAVIGARQNNLKIGADLYQKMQANALGLNFTQNTNCERSV